ncbi:MAG: hypothetical protein WCC08_10890 [Terrimicrobiaceae bacterium]
MATPDEIRESELGNKAKILGCCLRRLSSTDVWAADYGCVLVYETPDLRRYASSALTSWIVIVA